MCNKELFLTVFTPSYNRCRELERLYASLLNQTDMRFEWLVVDDGSSDGTESEVISWIEDAPFPLRCIRQENMGKHVAHNRGVQEAKGDLFVCVDSDDWLEPDAVATILADATALDAEEGLLYPRQFAEQTALDAWFPEGVTSVELADMRMKYGLVVETAIVFKVKVLARHPFPVVAGERYMPEGSAYYDFRSPELFLVRNTSFYRCEYLDEGLTRNIWANWLGNPVGTRMALGKRYEAALRYSGLRGLRERVSAIAGIESLNLAVKDSAFEGCSKAGPMRIAVLPLAALLYRKRFGKAVC